MCGYRDNYCQNLKLRLVSYVSLHHSFASSHLFLKVLSICFAPMAQSSVKIFVRAKRSMDKT